MYYGNLQKTCYNFRDDHQNPVLHEQFTEIGTNFVPEYILASNFCIHGINRFLTDLYQTLKEYILCRDCDKRPNLFRGMHLSCEIETDPASFAFVLVLAALSYHLPSLLCSLLCSLARASRLYVQ